MNKEEIMKEIEHIANCELYDTIGVKYLKGNIEKLFEENKQLKEEYENIINRYKFIRNRINQGMSIENKNKCLIELGNNILQEIDKLGDSNGNN